MKDTGLDLIKFHSKLLTAEELLRYLTKETPYLDFIFEYATPAYDPQVPMVKGLISFINDSKHLDARDWKKLGYKFEAAYIKINNFIDLANGLQKELRNADLKIGDYDEVKLFIRTHRSIAKKYYGQFYDIFAYFNSYHQNLSIFLNLQISQKLKMRFKRLRMISCKLKVRRNNHLMILVIA